MIFTYLGQRWEWIGQMWGKKHERKLLAGDSFKLSSFWTIWKYYYPCIFWGGGFTHAFLNKEWSVIKCSRNFYKARMGRVYHVSQQFVKLWILPEQICRSVNGQRKTACSELKCGWEVFCKEPTPGLSMVRTHTFIAGSWNQSLVEELRSC